MTTIWILYTCVTVFYIILLVIYFWRRSKKHEDELKGLLALAQGQLTKHKAEVHDQSQAQLGQIKVIVGALSQVIIKLRQQSQEEYKQVLEMAQKEAEEIKQHAELEYEMMTENADKQLEEYYQKRMHEIEENIIDLIMQVTQRVLEKNLDDQLHYEIIEQSLQEVQREIKKT